MNGPLDPETLAADLREVRRIYSGFFASLAKLDESVWDKPIKPGSSEWTLHETVAHLTTRRLDGKGLVSLEHVMGRLCRGS